MSPADLTALFTDIGADLSVEANPDEVLRSLVHLAARRVDGADYAGVTVGRHGARFSTVAATAPIVEQCDQIQYDLKSGPCVDALLGATTFKAGDLRVDGRWPEFGRRCAEETGIVSMLSMRFYVESDRDLIAGLNLYAHAENSFDESSEVIAHVLATHGALAVGRASADEKSRNLERALHTSREIGTAMGILMVLHKVTRDQAFDLLRIASQHSHRKLADIATEVVETGAVPRVWRRKV